MDLINNLVKEMSVIYARLIVQYKNSINNAHF